MAKWKLRYRDAIGHLDGWIESNGRSMSVDIDGSVFGGDDFDGLEPQVLTPSGKTRFKLHPSHGDLCDCALEVEIPVAAQGPDGERITVLFTTIRLGSPTHRGAISHLDVRLGLQWDGVWVSPSTSSQDFEDALAALQKELPAGCRLTICFICGLSDYSPFGHGLFGHMACFREAKVAYRKVDSKQAIFDLWDSMTEFVQETHCCPEFEPRAPDTGYRG